MLVPVQHVLYIHSVELSSLNYTVQTRPTRFMRQMQCICSLARSQKSIRILQITSLKLRLKTSSNFQNLQIFGWLQISVRESESVPKNQRLKCLQQYSRSLGRFSVCIVYAVSCGIENVVISGIRSVYFLIYFLHILCSQENCCTCTLAKYNEHAINSFMPIFLF